MNEYLVKVERDSVCMGDDTDAPHFYDFKISNTATLNEIFEHLERKHYLASVAGKNHSWEAIINNSTVAIFKGNDRQPEPTINLSNKISQYIDNATLIVYFKYNSATT